VFSEHGTFLDGERVPPGVPMTLEEGACLVFGQCTLEFRLLKVAAVVNTPVRQVSRRKRSSVEPNGSCATAVVGNSSPTGRASPTRSPSPHRTSSCSGRGSGRPHKRSSVDTSQPSPPYSSGSSSASEPAPPARLPKTVRWSPDMVRVHEVIGVEYPPDYFEATQSAVIYKNIVEAAAGSSPDEELDSKEPLQDVSDAVLCDDVSEPAVGNGNTV
jgi:hypothetical protein